MNTHNLKTIPPYWNDVASGKKNFELRFNDRDYKVGDILNLMEYIPETGKYTGNVCNVKVNYILREFFGAIEKDWIIMGIELIDIPF